MISKEENTKRRKQKKISSDDWNLIGQYTEARANGDDTKAEILLERINIALLTSKGEVSEIIAAARSQKTAIVQGVESRVEVFRVLLPKFREMPQFMIDRRWAEVRDEIMDAPTTEKLIISFGKGREVIRIGRDPEVARNILRFYRDEARKARKRDKAEQR